MPKSAEKSIWFATDMERELYLALTAIEARMERWQRNGIEAGVKGRDHDFKELVENTRTAIAHMQGRER